MAFCKYQHYATFQSTFFGRPSNGRQSPRPGSVPVWTIQFSNSFFFPPLFFASFLPRAALRGGRAQSAQAERTQCLGGVAGGRVQSVPREKWGPFRAILAWPDTPWGPWGPWGRTAPMTEGQEGPGQGPKSAAARLGSETRKWNLLCSSGVGPGGPVSQPVLVPFLLSDLIKCRRHFCAIRANKTGNFWPARAAGPGLPGAAWHCRHS